MKKKILLVSLGSVLALSTVAASVILFNNKSAETLEGTDVEYSITVTADDVTSSASYESKTVEVKTDQLENPVNFTFTNIKRNGDYMELKAHSEGSIGNSDSSAIYAIKNVKIYASDENVPTALIQWGWKVDETVEYPFSSNNYVKYPTGMSFDFRQDRPDYFKITNDYEDDDTILIEKMVITYGSECETKTSYGNPYKNVNKLKYKKDIDHWMVMGYAKYDDPVANLTFESTIDGLPVTEIAPSAFYFKGDVVTVDFEGSNITTIGSAAFYCCSCLTAVNFANSNVITIEDSAFNSCSELATINGFDVIEVIRENAFSGCAITSLTLGDNLREIYGSPFWHCDSMTSVTFSDLCEPTYLSDGCFNWCQGIEYVHIGSLMTKVPDFYKAPIKAFSVGAGSTSFKVDENGVLYSKHTESTYYLRRIGMGTELTNYVMPDYVDAMSLQCAEECTALETVTINKNVYSIAGSSFKGCTSLTTVSFEAGSELGCIYSEAFKGCTALTTINLPSTVSDINSEAFKNCTSLTSFTIPHNIGTLGVAFEGCGNIATMYYDGTVNEWNTRSIYRYADWYSGIAASVVTCNDGPAAFMPE